jgi:cell division protein FtsI (penicillin-binding protein 3)
VRPGVGRLLVLLLGFAAFALILVGKLVSVQIVHHDHYRAIAVGQHGYLGPIPAKRGTIYDRSGRVLATTMPAYRVYADPVLVDDAEVTASSISGIAGCNQWKLKKKLLNKKTRYVLIDLAMDVERALAIQRLGLKGVVIEPAGKRVRPFDEAASGVIGCFSAYEMPLSGIELKFDEMLKGTPGVRRHLRDARGRPVPCVEAVVQKPVAGNSLVLTLDIDLQLTAEKALDEAVETHGAKGGCVLIVDPWTGEVLAMASSPRGRNFPVRVTLEPGSSFKLCTYAAALDLKRVDSLSIFDTNHGKLKVAGGWIKDDHPRDEPLLLLDAFALSSNVAAALVAREIGCEDFYRYMLAFGFGIRTGIDLEGESPGILREPADWSKRSLETLAMGQEICVTAVQLAMAYSAVANGGDLMKPRLVKSVIDEDGKVKKKYPAKTVRRVIGKETAVEMTELLESVVQGGTGTLAGIPGIRVAGKTGTGQKAARGGYIAGKHNSVFAGFVPAGNPRYVCVVIVDEPSGACHYGGYVCGPVFKNVLAQVFRDDKSVVPSLCPRLAQRSESLLPPVDAMVSSAAAVPSAGGDGAERTVYPKVTGLTLREAAEVLEAAGLAWKARGSGSVIAQDPPARASLQGRGVCLLTLGGGR